MEKYEFHNVGNELYSFIWEDYCDWYIELSKSEMTSTTKSVLLKVLTAILKMLHPFMPYVTEEIYTMLPIKEKESIMISSYPKVEEMNFKEQKDLVDKIIEDIVSIRNLKATNNITKEAFIEIKKVQSEEILSIYKSQLKINEEKLVSNPVKDFTNKTYQSKMIDIIFYYEGEKEDDSKREEEIKKLELSIERREKLLSNENYVNKAPKNVVDMDRQKLQEEKERLELLKLKK